MTISFTVGDVTTQTLRLKGLGKFVQSTFGGDSALDREGVTHAQWDSTSLEVLSCSIQDSNTQARWAETYYDHMTELVEERKKKEEEERKAREERERVLKEKEAREKEALEARLKAQKEAKEKEANEKEAKEKEAKENEAKEKEAKENEAKAKDAENADAV
jgi:hypothetical protein